MTERSLHPVEYLLILKRRKAWFVVPLLLCTIVGIAWFFMRSWNRLENARVPSFKSQ